VSRWASLRPSGRGQWAVAIALGVLVLAGIGLRILVMTAARPAFLGYVDSILYIGAAQRSIFDDPGRPAGYPMFLWLTHVLNGSLSFTILVQHALGIVTALLLFSTVRRVAPAAWGLIPAAVVLLAGPQILLEHAPVSEAVFVPLVAGACYCAVRSLDDRPAAWAAAAALLAAMAVCLRSVGLLVPLILVAWLLVATSGTLKTRLRVGALALGCAVLVIGGYVVAAQRATGYVNPGLSRIGSLALYARTMTFADCNRFTPPAGTAGLCDPRPPSLRPGPFYYSSDADSPPVRAFGPLVLLRPAQDKQIRAFAVRAIVHQPFDYVRDVGTDLTRLWSSQHNPLRSGLTYTAWREELVRTPEPNLTELVRRWYSTGTQAVRAGSLDAMRRYEEQTRLEGPRLFLLILLALAGVPFARGRRLAAGILLIGVSVATIVAPVAFGFFDARYPVPGYGPLAAAGAIGAATLTELVRARLQQRRAPTVPAPRARTRARAR
jgi:hypothetical protein